MNKKLKDQVAIVTGASRGNGMDASGKLFFSSEIWA